MSEVNGLLPLPSSEDQGFTSGSEYEEDEVDPFSHKIELTRWQWIRTILLSVILFPLRVASVAGIICFAGILCFIGLFGLSEEDKNKVRRLFNHVLVFLTYMYLISAVKGMEDTLSILG